MKARIKDNIAQFFGRDPNSVAERALAALERREDRRQLSLAVQEYDEERERELDRDFGFDGW